MEKKLPICVVCKIDEENKKYLYVHIGVYSHSSFLICENCFKNYYKIFFNNNQKLIEGFEKEMPPYILKANKQQIKNFPRSYEKIGVSKIFNQTLKDIQKESKLKGINAFNWRTFAKKDLPEMYNHEEYETFYLFLFDFSLAIDDANRTKNYKLIKKIHKFSEKSYRSKSYYISNAISVSFYEHISDHAHMEYELKLIPKDIIKNCVIPLTKLVRSKNYKILMTAIKKNNIL